MVSRQARDVVCGCVAGFASARVATAVLHTLNSVFFVVALRRSNASVQHTGWPPHHMTQAQQAANNTNAEQQAANDMVVAS